MAAASRYGLSLKQLRELMELRGREGVARVAEYGSVQEIMRKLNTTEATGLAGEKSDLEHRRDYFGSNTIPPKPPKTFLAVSIFIVNTFMCTSHFLYIVLVALPLHM